MSAETPDPVDVYAGDRLRCRRRALGMSQETLGRALGITFQQIQKYERGTNRISASMLVRAARALTVEFGYFVEGLPDAPVGARADVSHAKRMRRLMAAAERLPAILLVPDLPKPACKAIGKVIHAVIDAKDGASDQDLEEAHESFRSNCAGASAPLQA